MKNEQIINEKYLLVDLNYVRKLKNLYKEKCILENSHSKGMNEIKLLQDKIDNT